MRSLTGAFSNCTSLTNVTILDSVTSIGDYAFNGCYYLQSITIGNSVTSIGDYAFNGCESLQSITIGNSVTNIGDYAFANCISLYYGVTIPDSVTNIGDYAFFNCPLGNVIIPNSVTSIGEYSFDDSIFLKIFYEGTQEEWDAIGGTPWGEGVYFYSETEPTHSGYYWHYGDNGEAVVW